MKNVLYKSVSALELFLRIIAKLLLLVPLLLAMAWFSFTVDRSGLFQGEKYELSVAQALLAGENLTGYDQMDERKILSLYVDNLEEAPDTIALGSSRVLQYTAELVGSGSFFNCGMSGADFYDILGSFYLFDRADKLPQNVVISLDAWLFNSGPDAYSPRSDVELYNEFLQTALGFDVGYEPSLNLDKYAALLEPSYFQGSLNYYLNEAGHELGPTVVEGDLYNQNGNVKMWDGSVLYDASYRNADIFEVEYRARQHAATFVRMDDFHELDEALIEIFDTFVQYMLDKNVNVIFVLVPYHPLVYNYAMENVEEFTGFFISEQWYTTYARANNIPLYGSYNPFVTGNDSLDFYDGLHITGEALGGLLPTIRQIITDQKSGRAGNPWLYGRERITWETAERIVMERYEIEAPHTIIRGEDETIQGEECYILERYSNDTAKAILLARYAVTQNEGTIYRFDTDINEWVVDNRFEN